MVSFWDRNVDRMGLDIWLLESDRTLVCLVGCYLW